MTGSSNASPEERGQSGRLEATLAARSAEAPLIDAARREQLARLATELARRLGETGRLDLLFVCTHNSRRSHMGQIWAQVAARRAGLDAVRTFSAGTEATAMAAGAVAALRRAGLRIEDPDGGTNPAYEVHAGDEASPMRCWSKVLADPSLPREGFVAIMTCSSADAACPTVAGAAGRVALTYEDPKAFDGTEREATAYDERCAQIAREMLVLFRLVAEQAGA